VRLTVVGSSPAWPNPGGAQSGYLLECDGQRLLLDCGPGVLPRLRVKEPWPRIDAIAITHFHLDHWGDLVPWVWGLTFGPAADFEPPELWVPPGGIETLATLGEQLGARDMFEGAFRMREYAADESFEAAGFGIVPMRVLHYKMLAFGFRVSRNGTVLAYSGDSGPDPQLVELARGAELFVCEATLVAPDSEGDLRGHLAVVEALDAFEQAGAKRLLLTHRPSERPVDNGYELAYDGLELEV
jgi:ribonuclease BN (tRNA processing enzyme)